MCALGSGGGPESARAAGVGAEADDTGTGTAHRKTETPSERAEEAEKTAGEAHRMAKAAEHKAKDAERRARHAGREAADSTSLKFAARVGTVAKGLLYVLVGYISAHIAVTGHSSEQASARGALEMVALTPVGGIVLWIVVGGLGGLVLRQLAMIVFGGWMRVWTTQRVAAVGRTFVYSLLFTTVLQISIGAAAGHQDQQTESITATLLGLPLGRVLVALIGLTLIGFGIALVFTMFRRNAYTHDIDFAAMPRRLRPAVVVLNIVGNLSRFTVISLAGVFVVWAALTDSARRTQGLDDTLRSISQAPAGPLLLGATGASLVSYGLYCFCKARWLRP